MNDANYQKIIEWQKHHDEMDNERFKNVPTEEKIEEIVTKVIKKELTGIGTGAYAWIKLLAVIIGSLAVIGGGFKWLLLYIGYQKI